MEAIYLQSMTDFVIQQRSELMFKELGKACCKYADFLKQPLTKEMFIGESAIFVFEHHEDSYEFHISQNRTVEYYTAFPNVQLTASAIKQIGL